MKSAVARFLLRVNKDEISRNQLFTEDKQPLQIGFKNGFYGQLILPLPNPAFMNSYYATPSSPSRPFLQTSISGSIKSYYPKTTNTSNITKRKVFQNSIPFCIPKNYASQRSSINYSDSDLIKASINLDYSLNNHNGYMTVPIGDSTFMSATQINGTSVSSAFTLYRGKNNFNTKIFIDPTKTPNATLYYNDKNNITGHLVAPVFKAGLQSSRYYSLNSNNNVILPLGALPTDLQSQVVYVPKGTSYKIYQANMNLSDWVGFVVLPVGDTDFLSTYYNDADINYSLLSQSPYQIYDQYGKPKTILSNDDLQDYLTAIASSSKPYFWNVRSPIKINKYFNVIFYYPQQSGQAALIRFPTGKYNNTMGNLGSLAKGADYLEIQQEQNEIQRQKRFTKRKQR